MLPSPVSIMSYSYDQYYKMYYHIALYFGHFVELFYCHNYRLKILYFDYIISHIDINNFFTFCVFLEFNIF